MPDAPPVTMKTLPLKFGRLFSVKVGVGGNSWDHTEPIVLSDCCASFGEGSTK